MSGRRFKVEVGETSFRFSVFTALTGLQRSAYPLKSVIFSMACLAACAPVVLFAQATSETAAPPAELPHQVGLIDMAYVFKNSHKFLSLTDGLQQEIAKTDGQAKLIVDRIRQLQTQLNNGEFASDSAKLSQLEEQLAQANVELETFKRVSQQSFLRKEAEIYKAVYLDVEDAVSRYATYYKYTLVLRFDRADVGTNDDPREVMNGMNRQVVHFQQHDDMTEPVLKFLNDQWKKAGGGSPQDSRVMEIRKDSSSGKVLRQ